MTRFDESRQSGRFEYFPEWPLRFLANLLALTLSKPSSNLRVSSGRAWRTASRQGGFPRPDQSRNGCSTGSKADARKRWNWRTTRSGDCTGTILLRTRPKTGASGCPAGPPSARQPYFLLCSLLSCYGLTPMLGGDGLGLVGADEPRYAQIAHEMLDRFDSAHTLKRPPQRLRHALSLRPSLAGEAGALLLAGDVHLSGLWRARLERAPALHQLRLHHGGAHLPAHAAIPARRASGCGADHRGLRRHHRLRARRIHRYADGRAAGHRPARLVRLVRNRLEVLALRHLLLYRRGHAGQGPGRAVSGRCSSSLPLPFCAASGASSAARSGGREWCSTSPWCCPGSSPCSIRTPPSSASSSSSTTWSASPPTAISTSSPSGTTWWWWCWP